MHETSVINQQPMHALTAPQADIDDMFNQMMGAEFAQDAPDTELSLGSAATEMVVTPGGDRISAAVMDTPLTLQEVEEADFTADDAAFLAGYGIAARVQTDAEIQAVAAERAWHQLVGQLTVARTIERSDDDDDSDHIVETEEERELVPA